MVFHKIAYNKKLVAFFATMNMYSSNKMQVSDTKEYQDFLQMYTGKTKCRETATATSYLYYLPYHLFYTLYWIGEVVITYYRKVHDFLYF